MRLSLRRTAAGVPAALFLSLAALAAAAEPAGRDAPQLYATLCASCHGENLEGGKGPALIAPEAQAKDDASLVRTIEEGNEDAGMPAFRDTLGAAEVNALVAFIRERATRSREPIPQDNQPLPTGTLKSEEHAFQVEWVAEGFDVPWSMAFLPDGRMLVTERGGRLRMLEKNGALRPEMIGGLPPVVVKDEAGLMSVAVDPDYEHNGWIYLSYSDPGPGEDTAMTKIIRARLRDWELVDRETIFSIPRENYPHGYALFGCRLVFDGDYLFFGVGVRGHEAAITRDAQDVTRANGKIHRVFHDGRVPPDNPFIHTPGAVGSIWALGVRNPQGLARNPRDGALWETEHGPRGGDELNHIERGKNYGWPLITYGINYNGTPVSDKTAAPGLEQPVRHWTPSIATSEIEFYTGDKFPRWKGNLFLGSLATQKFMRLVIDGDRVVHTEEVFKNLGRVRDIKTGPDGFIYIALELIGRPGRIVRLKPAE